MQLVAPLLEAFTRLPSLGQAKRVWLLYNVRLNVIGLRKSSLVGPQAQSMARHPEMDLEHLFWGKRSIVILV